jgi:hypothetical protein
MKKEEESKRFVFFTNTKINIKIIQIKKKSKKSKKKRVVFG